MTFGTGASDWLLLTTLVCAAFSAGAFGTILVLRPKLIGAEDAYEALLIAVRRRTGREISAGEAHPIQAASQ